jgi:hypothetical protein
MDLTFKTKIAEALEELNSTLKLSLYKEEVRRFL